MIFNIITCVIACGALAFTITIFIWGRKDTKSRLFLEQASRGFEEVINLLRDQNNNHVVWVRAARTLLKTKNLKKRIRLQEYIEGFEAEEERVRNELYTILTIVDEKTGERTSLPPQFFYGIDNWTEIKTLDEAAVKASHTAECYEPTIDEIPPSPKLQPLAEESVVAIFDFLEYPKSYSDPLKSVNVWGNNWEKSWGESQGARRYVAHRASKYAVAGKLHERRLDKP